MIGTGPIASLVSRFPIILKQRDSLITDASSVILTGLVSALQNNLPYLILVSFKNGFFSFPLLSSVVIQNIFSILV